jgi:hypothetical protein
MTRAIATGKVFLMDGGSWDRPGQKPDDHRRIFDTTKLGVCQCPRLLNGPPSSGFKAK